MTQSNGPLRARAPEGGTPALEAWGVDSEYGTLREVLLGPVESFHWMEDNAAYSSIVRDTLRKGHRFDKQLAVRQYREMVEAYEDAGVTVHSLDVNELTPDQVYARDSNFMTPFGAVVCQLANPRRRGEYAEVLRFYLSQGMPIYDMVSAGHFEGGDFNIIAPGSVLIGYTGFRCEEVAARQVGGWFEREGWEVKYASIDSFYVHIDLYQGALIMTHRDRAGDASGQRAGRREAAGDPGRKPWETVSMDHYRRSSVFAARLLTPPARARASRCRGGRSPRASR